MEVSTTAISVIKTSLQVISNLKHPQLEVYYEFKRIARPHNINGEKHYFTDSFIQFYLINISGRRAENIQIKFFGDDTYFHNKKIPNIVNGEIIEQMPPAQVFPLMKISEDELFEYIPDKKDSNSFSRGELKKTFIKLEINFDAPKSFLNSIFKKLTCKERLYKQNFIFKPSILNNSMLPEIEYKG